jgi:hypothetical protein
MKNYITKEDNLKQIYVWVWAGFNWLRMGFMVAWE